MSYKGNTGYLFYKDYYRKTDNKCFDPRKYKKGDYADVKGIRVEKKDILSDKNKVFFEEKNVLIEQYKPGDFLHSIFLTDPNDQSVKTNFCLQTLYPGLLTGSGYNHETGSIGEYKLGFFFDYTSGLPIIPGSSVKGVLRSAFPSYHLDEDKKAYKNARCEMIYRTIKDIKDDVKITLDEEIKLQIHKYEIEIFEGVNVAETLNSDERNKKNEFEWLKNKNNWKYFSIYQRDIFHDAVVLKSEFKGDKEEDKGRIFGNDFITPHINRHDPKLSPFTNPIPLQFLKILPNVIFYFQFDLKDVSINPETKSKLFQKILLTLGIGAKTNVGYGQFKKVSKEIKYSDKPEFLEEKVPENYEQILKKGEKFFGVVLAQMGDFNYYSFDTGNFECIIKKRSDKNPDMLVNDPVIIEFANNYQPGNPNMKVNKA